MIAANYSLWHYDYYHYYNYSKDTKPKRVISQVQRVVQHSMY